MSRLKNEHVEAIINLAKAADQLNMAPSGLVSGALPDLKLSDDEIHLIAALGKARDLKGLKPEEMTFLLDFDAGTDSQKRVTVDFSNLNMGKTGVREWSALVEDIVEAAKAGMPPEPNSGHPKNTYNVGWQNYVTGAIASHDNGNLEQFLVTDALAAVNTVVDTMEKQAAARRARAEKSTGVA